MSSNEYAIAQPGGFEWGVQTDIRRAERVRQHGPEESQRKPGLIRRLAEAFRSGVDLEALEEAEIKGLVQQVFVTESRRCVVFCGVDEVGGSQYVTRQAGRALASWVSGSVCVMERSPVVREAEAERQETDSLGPNTERYAPNLWVAHVNQPRGGSYRNVTMDELRARIDELTTRFDYLLMDAPPVCLSREAAALAQFSDGMVLILEANSTRRVAAIKAREMLLASNIRLLGVVLNNRSFPIPEKLYRKI